MARLGIAPHVADKVLNHQSGTISGVAAVYQRHEFLAERREALDRWGAHVEQGTPALARNLPQFSTIEIPSAPTESLDWVSSSPVIVSGGTTDHERSTTT
jgi:hypothetical protein